jgi:Kef-type K+ transport system membrane component KefB
MSSTIADLQASPAAAVPTLSTLLPTGWPPLNLMVVFGLLLAFGVLGGLLAARHRWLPTITGFMLVGLAVGPSGLGLLSHEALDGARVLVDVALGLILFKLGGTLHPMAMLRDRPLLLTSLAESLGTFFGILCLMLLIGVPVAVAVLVAAIAVSSSPAVLIHVAEELHARGPVLEKAKALVASNNVLSFVLFTLALPVALLGQQFDLQTSLLLPLYRLAGAVLVAAVVARVVTWVSGLTRPDEDHLRFALVVGAVLLTLGLSKALNVSGLFAGLALGIACRWMEARHPLTQVEFGGGGDIFFVTLFVFAGANLHLAAVLEQAPLALAFVLIRVLAKVGAVYGSQRAFGITARPAAAGGLLLVPMAGLAIGLVQTTTQLMPELGPKVAAIVLASVALFETIGPPLSAYAIRLAGEAGAGHT